MRAIKKNIKDLLFIPVILIALVCGNAQIKFVRVGVDGLTCSACCRSVEMSLRKLVIVKDVQMSLDNSEGIIYFTENAKINVESISRAVVKAGYSVRFLKANFEFQKLNVNSGFCYSTDSFNFIFINTSKRELNGQYEIQFLGERFQAKKDFNKYKGLLKNSCDDKDKAVFFVTL